MLGELQNRSAERKAGFILLFIALTEGTWVLFNFNRNPAAFLRYAGFPLSRTGLRGWALAISIAVIFTAYSAKLPSVRANLFRPSLLKFLAFLVALAAGLCEECVFRKFLMDSLMQRGLGPVVQIMASAAAFGLVHAIWGLMRGSIFAAFRATLATGSLGLALAVLYLVSNRVVATCVVAHFIINLLAEPGLVLAALKGEMSSPGVP